jgi:hypothetical protein
MSCLSERAAVKWWLLRSQVATAEPWPVRPQFAVAEWQLLGCKLLHLSSSRIY